MVKTSIKNNFFISHVGKVVIYKEKRQQVKFKNAQYLFLPTFQWKKI